MSTAALPESVGYAVIMADGRFVGIWSDRPIADAVCAKQPPSHGDRVIPVYDRPGFDLIAHLHRQREFSENTFGPGSRTRGIIDHIRKELLEVEAAPAEISEWIDIVLLALDGAWRAGHSPEAIATALDAKQTKNERRAWPDWRTAASDKAIEHVRKESAT
jgi:hypothetical protein